MLLPPQTSQCLVFLSTFTRQIPTIYLTNIGYLSAKNNFFQDIGVIIWVYTLQILKRRAKKTSGEGEERTGKSRDRERIPTFDEPGFKIWGV